MDLWAAVYILNGPHIAEIAGVYYLESISHFTTVYRAIIVCDFYIINTFMNLIEFY